MIFYLVYARIFAYSFTLSLDKATRSDKSRKFLTLSLSKLIE